MAQPLTDASPAYVLGELADLTREERALLAQANGALLRVEGLDEALATAAHHSQEAFVWRSEGHGAARKLAEQNQLRAELLPKLTKLRDRQEALRVAQEAEADPQAARVLRRSRAVVSVQIEDMERATGRAQQEAESLRAEVHRLEAAVQQGKAAQQKALKQVHALQSGLLGLAPRVRLLGVQLALAHARLRLGGPDPSTDALAAWSKTARTVADDWLTLSHAMAAGRFEEAPAQALMGGRAPLCAEVLAAYVAMGDLPKAEQAFAQMCSGHSFLHQIFHVFRAFAWGLFAGDARAPLIEVLRLHRYEQGLRGHLAACFWALVCEDEAGFVRLLPKLVQEEARMWSQSDLPALGLISVSGCAMVRLGRMAGFEVPKNLGPTVPPGPWSVATAPEVR